MSIFEKLIDFVSGGVGGKIVESVAAHFPPSMSEKDREQMKLVVAQASRQYELELLKIAQQEQEAFNSRVKDLEGTAADLKSSGWPGRIILFLRGAQRPIWGFAVLFMDFMVFSGQWKLVGTTGVKDATGAIQMTSAFSNFDLQSAFWIINFLVLGFLFGERAMRNVMPFFQKRFQGGSAQAPGETQSNAVG
jgi:hypothetical protein